MTRAEAYALAQSRGFDKSIAVFGSKFTSDPSLVICGIKRQGRGVYVDVLEENGFHVAGDFGENLSQGKIAQEQLSAPVAEGEKIVAPVNTETVSGQEAGANNKAPSKDREEDKNTPDRPARVKKKIYTANGTHQAICRFQGILMPKPDDEKGFKLLLPGLELDATFAFPKTAWFYRKSPQAFEGVQNYIGYPRMNREGKLVKVYIVSVDRQQDFSKEQWEFIGMWCGPQKSLFVQRRHDMFPDEPRPHYYKYRFQNQGEYRKYLWDRYAYQIIARRDGDQLSIVRNNPFACPRRKPEPPQAKGKALAGKPGQKREFERAKKD
jgi:hypothetical protein